MKVILVKDVKGHGKKGEIIDFNLGFANHLIRSGQAIVVSDENLKRLDEQKKQAQLEEERHIQEMKDLKKKIDETPIKIGVKIGVEGKIFGTVSMKQVCDAFQKTGHQRLGGNTLRFRSDLLRDEYDEFPVDCSG